MTILLFEIPDMDCAEEVGALKHALAPTVGEENLSFDLLKRRLRVEIPVGSAVTSEEVERLVRTTGMRARPVGVGATRPLGFWGRHGHVLLCGLSGLLTVSGFLFHTSGHGFFDALAGSESAGHGYPPLPIALFAGACLAGAWFFLPKAWAALRRLRPDMNLLMVVAVTGAIVLGEWFEAATVSFLFSLALVLESWSVDRARHAIERLMDLAPARARVLQPDGSVAEIGIEAVEKGSTVRVRPGERFPLDGVVTRGATSVDQAPITGESIPVAKDVGDDVFAGTINQEGAVDFATSRRAEDTTLARIIQMVEDAQSRRAVIERWTERFARVYTPVMMLVALLVAVVPPLALGGSWGLWVYNALVVLVIACPCALVISTPVSIVAGLASAARAGVLIKGGVYLEAPAHLRVIALDKTGTLTLGKPSVERIEAREDHTAAQVLEAAASLEAQSGHPLARAIVAHAAEQGIRPEAVGGFREIRGKGAEGVVGGRDYWIGSQRLMAERGAGSEADHAATTVLEAAGYSVIALGRADHVCGLIAVADALRPDVARTVQAMREAGAEKVVMLTGDHEAAAARVAAASGVDDYRASLLPEEKVAAVEALRRDVGQVAMVGDGVNDAPAMAVSNLGIAMGAMGTDAAIEAADIALMSDDLAKIPWLLRHSRRTLGIIRQNIVLALGTKLVVMGFVVAGHATLWMAISADMGASLVVIFNALRLLRGRTGPAREGDVVPAGGGMPAPNLRPSCTVCADDPPS
ncbi:MAG: heavy metal translocating P-type ATPase [Planctomycetota bacterium]